MSIRALAPEHARAARAHVGLSQAKVGAATGISRTKLALFEVGKYILDDATLEALRSFYAEQGYDFESTQIGAEAPKEAADRWSASAAATEEAAIRVVDGFAVPPAAEPEEIEAALGEVIENDRRIEELATQAARAGWFSEEPETTGRDEIMRLMARNYWLIRRVQGAELLPVGADPSNGAERTHGVLAAALLDA